MSVLELFSLLRELMAQGASDYLVLVQDEDEEVYPLQDSTVDADHACVLLQLDTRPADLR